MTVTDVVKDPENRTMTITAEFGAPVERVWQIWADPRQLERWWGPPTYPATVVDHDLSPGGAVNYFMTGPEGDKHAGWWRVSAVVPPNRLEFEDGFADGEGRAEPGHAGHRHRRHPRRPRRRRHPHGDHLDVRRPSRRWNSSSPWAWTRG